MAKLIGILLIVVGVWVGVEVYSQGLDGAFGGRLASRSAGGAEPIARRSTPQRAGDAVVDAHHEAADRRARLLAE
jgi:hypothetical protein